MLNGLMVYRGFDNCEEFEITAVLSSFQGGDWHLWPAVSDTDWHPVNKDQTIEHIVGERVVAGVMCLDPNADPIFGRRGVEYPFLILYDDGLCAIVKARR